MLLEMKKLISCGVLVKNRPKKGTKERPTDQREYKMQFKLTQEDNSMIIWL